MAFLSPGPQGNSGLVLLLGKHGNELGGLLRVLGGNYGELERDGNGGHGPHDGLLGDPALGEQPLALQDHHRPRIGLHQPLHLREQAFIAQRLQEVLHLLPLDPATVRNHVIPHLELLLRDHDAEVGELHHYLGLELAGVHDYLDIVRGTKFDIRVLESLITQVLVLSGKVYLGNLSQFIEQKIVELSAGEHSAVKPDGLPDFPEMMDPEIQKQYEEMAEMILNAMKEIDLGDLAEGVEEDWELLQDGDEIIGPDGKKYIYSEEQGGFVEPLSSISVRSKFEGGSNPVKRFVRDWFEVNDSSDKVKWNTRIEDLKIDYKQYKDIVLWDFDGYDYHNAKMTMNDVINCPTKKMGHAFVLAMMLEEIVK